MPGWFDLYDWPIAVGSKDDKEKLLEGIQSIRSVVERLQGDGVERIVVGGFSQGGAVALLSAYHPAGLSKNVVGCVSLSGWLTLAGELKPQEDRRPPLFWGHGTFDDKVLFEQQAFGVEKLQAAGVASMDVQQYPIGHSSHPDELRGMADFLVSTLFPEESSKSSEL